VERTTANRDVAHRRGRFRPRRGSTYIIVLAVALIVSTIGLSVMMITRVLARQTTSANDWSEAATLAHSAVEHGLTMVNNDSSWRSGYANGVPIAEKPLGRGTISWTLEDTDGSLTEPDTSLRLTGIGKVGNTTRVYSVQLEGLPQILDVFQRATYSTEDILVSAEITATGGPISTPATLTVNNTLNGDAEAGTLVNAGTITGTTTTPFDALTMPAPGVFDTYLALATEIPFSSIPDAKISNTVLSDASNPYGVPNPDAVYHVNVPAGSSLQITASRLVATLLLTLNANSTVKTAAANLWQTPSDNYPMLIIKGTTGSQVDLNGFALGILKEASSHANYNPPGTPYEGQTDDDQLDVYPNEFNGLIHVIGSATQVNAGSNFVLKGSLVSEGPVTLGSNYNVTLDPSLYDNPPYGYTQSSGEIVTVAGTWRWDAAP